MNWRGAGATAWIVALGWALLLGTLAGTLAGAVAEQDQPPRSPNSEARERQSQAAPQPKLRSQESAINLSAEHRAAVNRRRRQPTRSIRVQNLELTLDLTLL